MNVSNPILTLIINMPCIHLVMYDGPGSRVVRGGGGGGDQLQTVPPLPQMVLATASFYVLFPYNSYTAIYRLTFF